MRMKRGGFPGRNRGAVVVGCNRGISFTLPFFAGPYFLAGRFGFITISVQRPLGSWNVEGHHQSYCTFIKIYDKIYYEN